MNQPLTLIDKGTGADSYLRADGCILRLLHQGIPLEVACRELLGMQVARAAGVKTPVVREMVEFQGRWGIVFEPVVGDTMMFALINSPERAEELGRQMAALHADIHSRGGSFLPTFHDVVRFQMANSRILDERIKSATLAALDALPRGTALCHGDFHPGTIVPTESGTLIIDWFNAVSGCPAADVARTVLLLRFGGPAEDADPQLVAAVNAVRTRLHNAYCRHYAELRPADAEQVASWTLPMAALHLMRPTPERERQAILALVEPLLPDL